MTKPATCPDFDLVIFDCDGVLIDSELISAEMLILALADHGLSIGLDYIRQHFLGRSYPVVLTQIRKDYALDLPPSFEAEYRARLLAAFETQLRVMPQVETVLRDLGRPFCVATSSSPQRVTRSLALVGLDMLVGPHVFTASQVTHGKPAPDLFLFAAERMGVAPGRCLVIEDSLTGLRAARAAGMSACRFTGGSHLSGPLGPEPDDARPDCHVASFAEFFDHYPDLKRKEPSAP